MTDKLENITNEQKEEDQPAPSKNQAENKNKDEKEDVDISNFAKNIFGIAFLLVGAATYGWNMYDFPVKDFLQKYGEAVLGVFIMILGGLTLIFSSIIPYLKAKSPNDFAEVDREYATNKNEINSKANSESLHVILKRIESKLDTTSTQTDNNKDIDTQLDIISFDLVKSTLTQTINTLENKADAADKKASILLQRGVSLTKFGIVYYLLSIIIWQIVFFKSPYKPEHLYGILSCSFLFLFIEFLSAWFLKQYKNFTDNSIYLLKIKSIFDRFLIVYLIDENQNEGKNPDNINFKKSLDLLSKDFAWPDTSVIESKEQTFARETISSITELINAIKPKEKESAEK